MPGGADAYGVRISSLNAYSPSQAVMVAELYAFEAGPTINLVAGSNDQMRLAPLQTPLASDFRNFYFGTLSTTSMSTLADTLNKRLRGYQVEALRSAFGYLWLRGTVQGDDSYMTVDTVANGSTITNQPKRTASST